MKQEVKIGQTDYTTLVIFRDSTTGLSKTGLTGASAGLNAAYTRVETDNDVTITEHATLHALATPALTDVHLDWGFIEVDATHAPGLYRLDLPDEVFATGAWSAVVSLVCTGCDTVHMEFILVPESPYTGVNVSMWEGHAVHAHITEGLPVVDVHTIQNGTIVAATFGAGAIDAAAIANGAIDAATFAADAITSTVIADNAITANKLNANCITEAKIADNALANEHFAAGALTSAEITSAAGCVVASIANDAITAAAVDDDGEFLVGKLTVTDRVTLTGGLTITGTTLHTGAVTLTNGINAGAISGTLANDIITAAAIQNGAIDAATFAAGAIDAAAIKDAAIDIATFAADCKTGSALKANVETITAGIIANASFNADVGSTAYATNIIAIAVRKVLDELNLDHLMKTAVANNADMSTEVPDGTVLSNVMTKTGDTSDYAYATDSLEALGIIAEDWTNGGRLDLLLDAVGDPWAKAIPGAYGVGTAGLLLGTTIPNAIDAVDNYLDTELAAITAAVITNAAGVDIAADIIAMKVDTAAILADTGTDGVLVAAAAKAGYALSATGADLILKNATFALAIADAVWEEVSTLGGTYTFDKLMNRVYQILNNAMTIDEATGAVVLKTIGGAGNLATGDVDSAAGTTDRDELTWA